MAHAKDINQYVRNSQNGIKSALCKLYKSRLDTKLARTYTDDIDVNTGVCRLSASLTDPVKETTSIRVHICH